MGWPRLEEPGFGSLGFDMALNAKLIWKISLLSNITRTQSETMRFGMSIWSDNFKNSMSFKNSYAKQPCLSEFNSFEQE